MILVKATAETAEVITQTNDDWKHNDESKKII